MEANYALISFNENGNEYTGFFTVTDWTHLAFDPNYPRRIVIDSVKLEMDEDINGIDVNGTARTIAEAWEEGKTPR